MTKNIFLIGLLFFSVGSFASDVPGKAIAKCAVIEGDLARLDCFDQLAKAHKLNGPQSQPVNVTDTGGWVVSQDQNPVDDSKTVILINRAKSGVGRYGDPVTLLIRCKSNSTDLFVNWNTYLGSEISVLSRVGAEKAESEEWDLSTDKKATFHPAPIPFIKSILTNEKLVLQTTPYNENPITAVFDTRGLNNAIKPLREVCGW